jgi:hypothetical protein
MNIIELAREAGFHKWYTQPREHPDHVAIVARFAALVRAEVLEEAAGVCEVTLAQHYMKQVIPTHDEALLLAACADCAAAIRKLKEKT